MERSGLSTRTLLGFLTLAIRTKYVGTKVTTRLLADLMLPRNKIVIFCLNCFYDLLRFLKNILIINKIIKKFFLLFSYLGPDEPVDVW
jgi:hypothetical protein